MVGAPASTLGLAVAMSQRQAVDGGGSPTRASKWIPMTSLNNEERKRLKECMLVLSHNTTNPVGAHMFNSTLVGNAQNWFSKLPRRSIDGFEELRKAFRLNFTQRKKYAKNPVELARVKQRQGESTSAYVERYKDECIHVKACPEILKISGFMNGINNPELIKRRSRRCGQQKRLLKLQVTGAAQEIIHDTEEILATEGANFPKPPPMRTPKEQRDGNGYCEYYRQKRHTTTKECVQLRQLIDKLVQKKKAGWITWLRTSRKEKTNKKAGQRKTRQKVSQNFSHGSEISFPTLAADNTVAEPLTIEINAVGHDIHRMYIDGGASADILYEHCFQRLRPEVKSQLNLATTTLACQLDEFNGDRSRSPYMALMEDPMKTAIRGYQSTVREAVCALLQRNLDIFVWEPKHMTGVPRSITEHKLKIQQGYFPVWQKKRGQAPERAKAILRGIMVKKSDGNWRMCVDFTDLNKACPQDCYSLLEIDWKENEEKTAFHISQGVYCYTKMPFGLKNAGATYQRLVDNAFEREVDRNLEVYVDGLVIKSHTEDELVRDIEETFRMLRKINMKLNPKKCTFGATEGMFLGYLIEPDGIKPCPEKTKAVIQLPLPRTMKEVQSLNGKLAGLNRFMSKSADKSLPLFKTLKKCIKKGDFHWTTEAEEAFT
ncbi:reverse transcriptase domain-containing protein [Tanacetum coccineum]